MSFRKQKRRPKGPGGGQFEEQQLSSADISLLDDDVSADSSSNMDTLSEKDIPVSIRVEEDIPALEAIERTTDPFIVEGFALHQSEFVRAEVASSRFVSEDVLGRLKDDSSWIVRWTVASRRDSLVPLGMLDDPNPIVAAVAAEHPMVDEEERSGVRSRADVSRLMFILSK